MGSLCCVAAKSDRSNSTSGDFSFGPHEPYWRTNTSFSPPSSRWDVHGLIDNTNYFLRSPDLPHWTPNDSESATRRGLLNLNSHSILQEPNHNFSSRRFSLSKPIHPILLNSSHNVGETTTTTSDSCSWSSGTTSSIDSIDVVPEPDLNKVLQAAFKCGLCNRHLSQKSPCGSRSIVRNRDMPVTGVLPCQHVFHAECLDNSTPKARRDDPPCPICFKHEAEQSKACVSVPKLKPVCEDGTTTRPWGCAQVGDCVENAVNVPPGKTMITMNRNRIRKGLSLRGNSSQDSPMKVKKGNSFAMESVTNQVSLVGGSRGKEKALW